LHLGSECQPRAGAAEGANELHTSWRKAAPVDDPILRRSSTRDRRRPNVMGITVVDSSSQIVKAG
jgi:hypothetical protein